MQFLGDHWEYYADEFDWPSDGRVPDIEATMRFYRDSGLSVQEAEALILSGYVSLTGKTIIDRYYGGALLSSDGATRIDHASFGFWYERAISKQELPPGRVSTSTAVSLVDLEKKIQELQDRIGLQLLYRGQTKHYSLSREITNPALRVEGYGEPSFVPSIWRRMLTKRPNAFHWFRGLAPLEWARVLDSQFDLDDIERRIKIESQGGLPFSAQDMEDSDDPILSVYGRVRTDLLMGYNHNLADLLSTLMQHYGLASPYLDLTADLRTGLFFSSHDFQTGAPTSNYRYVSNNGGQSVLYIFRRKRDEMADYAKDRVLHALTPLRPERQACVVCRSGPYAINLAGLYLVAIFRLDFELPPDERLTTSELFPDRERDNFLSAMLGTSLRPDLITQF